MSISSTNSTLESSSTLITAVTNITNNTDYNDTTTSTPATNNSNQHQQPLSDDTKISGVIAVGAITAALWLFALVCSVASLIRLYQRAKTGSLEMWLLPPKKLLCIFFIVWSSSMLSLDCWWMSGRVESSSPLIIMQIISEGVCRPCAYLLIGVFLLVNLSDIIRLKFYLMERKRKKKEERVFAGETSDDQVTIGSELDDDDDGAPEDDDVDDNIHHNDDEFRGGAGDPMRRNNNNNNNGNTVNTGSTSGASNAGSDRSGELGGTHSSLNMSASGRHGDFDALEQQRNNNNNNNSSTGNRNNNSSTGGKQHHHVTIKEPGVEDQQQQRRHSISNEPLEDTTNNNPKNEDIDTNKQSVVGKKSSSLSGDDATSHQQNTGQQQQQTANNNNNNNNNLQQQQQQDSSDSNNSGSNSFVEQEHGSSTVSSNPFHNANVPNPFALAGIPYTDKETMTGVAITNLNYFPRSVTSTTVVASNSSFSHHQYNNHSNQSQNQVSGNNQEEMMGVKKNSSNNNNNNNMQNQFANQMGNRNDSWNEFGGSLTGYESNAPRPYHGGQQTQSSSKSSTNNKEQHTMMMMRPASSAAAAAGGGINLFNNHPHHNKKSTSNNNNNNSANFQNPSFGHEGSGSSQNNSIQNFHHRHRSQSANGFYQSNIYTQSSSATAIQAKAYLSPLKVVKTVLKNFYQAQALAVFFVLWILMFVIIAIVDAAASTTYPDRDCSTDLPDAAYCCRLFLDKTPNRRAFLIEEPLVWNGMTWALSVGFCAFWWFAAFYRIRKKWNVASAARFYVVYLIIAGLTTLRALIAPLLLLNSFRREGGSYLAVRSISHVLDAVFIGIVALHYARYYREKPRANLEPGVILL